MSWKSKGLSDDVIKSPTINNNIHALKLEYINKKTFVKFNEKCLIKQNKSTFNRKIVNIYIVDDLDSNSNDFDPTQQNCLFGAVNLTKNSENISIVVIALALIQKEVFHIQMALVEMLLFLDLI